MNSKINSIKLVGILAILVGVFVLSACTSSDQTTQLATTDAAQISAPSGNSQANAATQGNGQGGNTQVNAATQDNDQGGNGQVDAATQEQYNGQGSKGQGANGGATNVDQNGNINQSLDGVAVGDLGEAETEGILFMREEEKLARDVYLTLYDAWGMSLFQNIAGSEQTHMDAVLSLIERYGLEDPALGSEVGVFTNPDLQALYDQLVEQGSASLADALKVGGAIEEIDILDLEKYLTQSDNADIQMVYNSLLQGSNNHLRAFTSTLERQTGETYQPQYLSQSAYDAIANSAMERGGKGQDGGQGQGNGRGNGQGRRAGS